MQNTNSFKQLIKKQPVLFNALREVKIKWQNYFAEQGEVPRIINNFLAGFDQELQGEVRKKIAKKMWQTAHPKTIQLIEKLNKNGYALVNFSDLNVSPEPALTFLDGIIENFKSKENDQQALTLFESGNYNGKPYSYYLHKKKVTDQTMDPLMSLVCDPRMVEIASMYLGYLPLIGFSTLMYTPVHKGDQFGAQLWHLDLHHKRCLKIFFSPVEIDQSQGPFEFFPPELSTLKYYKYFPQSMTDEQIQKQGLAPSTANAFLAKRGQVLLVDTTRCLHRGGRTTLNPRYIATSGYYPPTHSFSAKKFRQTEHYEYPFRLNKRENEALLKQYSK